MVTTTRRLHVISDAGLLFLKLAAFALMVVDHADWFLFDGSLGLNATVGRAVAPAFALVLAMNLQRVHGFRHEARILARMVAVGVLAHVPYAFLQGHLLPLNIMFTLALAVAIISLWRSGQWLLPVVLFVFVSPAVDYAWCGVGAVVAAYWLIWRGYGIWNAAIAAAGLLTIWNGSLWSFLVLPLVYGAQLLQGRAPRLKWLFYVGYPVHLVALALFAAAFAR